MSLPNAIVRIGLAGCAAIALSAPVHAEMVTWYLQSGASGCSNSGSGNGNSRTCPGSPGGSPSVTANAWAYTGNENGGTNNSLRDAYLGVYSGGLGVTNRDSSSGDTNEGNSPEHATDNNDRVDGILLSIAGSDPFALTTVGFGWVGRTDSSTSYDSDFTLFALTSGAPSLDGQTRSELTASGWQLVGHYAGPNSSGGGTVSVNPGGISSQYWFITAYDDDPLFSGGPSTSGVGTGYLDYFKLKLVKAERTTRDVPEPGTALLLGVALLGAWRVRRKL